MSSSPIVVDWERCREQVQGDDAFLQEVFGDFLIEAQQAQDEISDRIANSHWNGVMNAAHRVKGSSAYLYCESMRVCALNLQELGHKATSATPEQLPELVKSINAWFTDFKDSLAAVEREVSARYAKK